MLDKLEDHDVTVIYEAVGGIGLWIGVEKGPR